MFGRLFDLFKRTKVRVQGVDKLPEGQSRRITIGDPLANAGVDIILARVDGQIHAVDNRCPHAGGFIQDGPLLEGKYLTCPLHQYHFDPKTGAAINAACRKARVYKCQTDGADVEISI
jgi:nitrite reductase/ring-hydroxylating ferredoxin subunit